MSSYLDSGYRTLRFAADIQQFARVNWNGTLAGAADMDAGIATRFGEAGSDVSVSLLNKSGTHKAIADGPITAFGNVFAGANGTVSAAGSVGRGLALQNATDAGDIIEVLPIAQGAATTGSGLTAAAAQTLIDASENTRTILRTNNITGVGPSNTDWPTPTIGDVACVVLNDGTKEYWAYDGTDWGTGPVITITPPPIRQPILRTNATADVAPTAAEFADPMANEVACVVLSDGVKEYWRYNGADWGAAPVLTIPASSGAVVLPIPTEPTGVAVGTAPTIAQLNAASSGTTYENQVDDVVFKTYIDDPTRLEIWRNDGTGFSGTPTVYSFGAAASEDQFLEIIGRTTSVHSAPTAAELTIANGGTPYTNNAGDTLAIPLPNGETLWWLNDGNGFGPVPTRIENPQPTHAPTIEVTEANMQAVAASFNVDDRAHLILIDADGNANDLGVHTVEVLGSTNNFLSAAQTNGIPGL